MEKKLTYKDFEIGEIITCIDDDGFTCVTIGKQYKIIDLDFHFHDSICVETDTATPHTPGVFLNIKNFKKNHNYFRKKKLERILK